jgi:hypothetical protein
MAVAQATTCATTYQLLFHKLRRGGRRATAHASQVKPTWNMTPLSYLIRFTRSQLQVCLDLTSPSSMRKNLAFSWYGCRDARCRCDPSYMHLHLLRHVRSQGSETAFGFFLWAFCLKTTLVTVPHGLVWVIILILVPSSSTTARLVCKDPEEPNRRRSSPAFRHFRPADS